MSAGSIKRSRSLLATAPSSSTSPSKLQKTENLAKDQKRRNTFEDIDLINDYVSNKPLNLTETEIMTCRSELMSWYHTNRRKLPWRGDTVPDYPPPPAPSPYGTWVSEVYMQIFIYTLMCVPIHHILSTLILSFLI